MVLDVLDRDPDTSYIPPIVAFWLHPGPVNHLRYPSMMGAPESRRAVYVVCHRLRKSLMNGFRSVPIIAIVQAAGGRHLRWRHKKDRLQARELGLLGRPRLLLPLDVFTTALAALGLVARMLNDLADLANVHRTLVVGKYPGECRVHRQLA